MAIYSRKKPWQAKAWLFLLSTFFTVCEKKIYYKAGKSKQKSVILVIPELFILQWFGFYIWYKLFRDLKRSQQNLAGTKMIVLQAAHHRIRCIPFQENSSGFVEMYPYFSCYSQYQISGCNVKQLWRFTMTSLLPPFLAAEEGFAHLSCRLCSSMLSMAHSRELWRDCSWLSVSFKRKGVTNCSKLEASW